VRGCVEGEAAEGLSATDAHACLWCLTSRLLWKGGQEGDEIRKCKQNFSRGGAAEGLQHASIAEQGSTMPVCD
jgi:hypothetical protein